ncbi:MAG: response regulator transcription factor [Ferruginibacter sp.]|nr:response regulator transcription factor [Ferruginibacter sp.]
MSKLAVALVDDHVMLRNGLANLIQDMDEYEVILQADNGKDFIEIINTKKQNPDIVLLDVSMPHIDGFETAKWVTANLPLAKILALSMFDDEKSIIKMIQNGAKGYILKDSDPKELATAMYNVVHTGYHYSDLVNGKLIYAINKLDKKSDTTTYEKITNREKEFLKLACSEMSYKEIATIMYLSVRTVEGYRDNLFLKLNLKSRVGLVLYAIKNKIHEI